MWLMYVEVFFKLVIFPNERYDKWALPWSEFDFESPRI